MDVTADNINIMSDAKRIKDREKKGMPSFRWGQNNVEVNVTFQFPPEMDMNNVYLEVKDKVFYLTISGTELTDAITWIYRLYNEIDASKPVVVRIEGKHLTLKLMKKNPNVHWQHLEHVNKTSSFLSKGDSVFKSPHKLEHVKYAWYEKVNNIALVTMYVKMINKDSLEVNFESQSFNITFQTNDSQFLQLHSGTTEETIFHWAVDLSEAIVPEESNFTLNQTVLDLILKKAGSKRWVQLEASFNSGGIRNIPSNTWVSANTIGDGYQQGFSHLSLYKNNNHKKPTCLVTPLNKQKEDGAPFGLTGLTNLGNTCFMNSVLQCLANTTEFRDFFLEHHFKNEINFENPLGFGGNLALVFSTFLKSLWSGNEKSHAPNKLKILISTKAKQFTGYVQHDAQEFMAFLLDGLHEDLNRVTAPPSVNCEPVNIDDRPDIELAEEAWQNHKLRNDSKVIDLFYGQFKSKLKCPYCNKVSITFDPFLYLAIPLPKINRTITFFPLETQGRPVKFNVHFSHDATVPHLKQKISMETRVTPDNLRVYEITNCKFGIPPVRLDYHGYLPASSSHAQIFVFEVYPEKLAGEPVLELFVFQRTMVPSYEARCCSSCKKECASSTEKLKRCTKCYRACYCDQTCQKTHWPVHKLTCKLQPDLVGWPFLLSLPKSQATFSNICHLMDAKASLSVSVFQPPVVLCDNMNPGNNSSNVPPAEDTDAVSPPPSLITIDNLSSHQESSDITPTETPMEIDDNSENTDTDTNETTPDSTHSSQIATRAVFGQPCDEPLMKHEWRFSIRPVSSLGLNLALPVGAILEDKGDEPLQLETLQHLAMDWQNYEKKKNYVLVQTKELDCQEKQSQQSMSFSKDATTLEQCLQLFTEPENLLSTDGWFCPTCKKNQEAVKEMKLWRLPKILIIQLKRFSFKHMHWHLKINKMVDFPLMGLDMSSYYCGPLDESESKIYDLYAVVNHHGEILTGHYTTNARLYNKKNSTQSDIEWRTFNDSRVQFIRMKEIVTPDAYLLFYIKREPAMVNDPEKNSE